MALQLAVVVECAGNQQSSISQQLRCPGEARTDILDLVKKKGRGGYVKIIFLAL